MARASYYQTTIREVLAANGRIGTNPRHVEAWMRNAHPTLDHLSKAEFTALALAVADDATADPVLSERLAEAEGIAK